jgi:hypothetical protein
VQVKTNEELVHILGWLGGANDVQYEFEHGGPQSIIRDLQRRFDWSFAGLKLFRNGGRNNSTEFANFPSKSFKKLNLVQIHRTVARMPTASSWASGWPRVKSRAVWPAILWTFWCSSWI